MKIRILATGLVAALATLAALYPAVSAADEVVIGDIDDLSGTYADVMGAGGIEAVKMAIADFEGEPDGLAMGLGAYPERG